MQRKTSSTICSAWIQQALETCLLCHASVKGITPVAQFSRRNRLHGDVHPELSSVCLCTLDFFFLFKEKHFNTCKVVWCGYSPKEATPESPEKYLKNASPLPQTAPVHLSKAWKPVLNKDFQAILLSLVGEPRTELRVWAIPGLSSS